MAGTPALVLQVETALAGGNVNLARVELKQFRDASGVSPEYLEALSWIGRFELARRNYSAAEANADEVRSLCLAEVKKRWVDADASLPMALGASIEVRALAAAEQGRRDEAVSFLRAELQQWGATSIHNRIQKNLHLLTLEGKPAPPPATPGHAALLFFWAHWCSDCKHEEPIIEHLQRRFGPAGLVVIAPTEHYGYVAGGVEASREVEGRYIDDVWAKFYSGLGPVKRPVSELNFAAYGVSTTPTLVLTDKRGIVRMYNPGALDEATLADRISAVLK